MRMKSQMAIMGVLVTGLFISVTTYAQKDPVTLKSDAYSYVDLHSGETVILYYDTLKWVTVNKATSKPVDFYIIRYNDRTDYDTVHGVTGIITNGLLVKNGSGQWNFDELKVKWDGSELKMKDRYGRKVKWEAGEMKIKDWNSKYKSEDGEEAKYKQEWDKIKWKEDGSTKIEVGTGKVKSDQ